MVVMPLYFPNCIEKLNCQMSGCGRGVTLRFTHFTINKTTTCVTERKQHTSKQHTPLPIISCPVFLSLQCYLVQVLAFPIQNQDEVSWSRVPSSGPCYWAVSFRVQPHLHTTLTCQLKRKNSRCHHLVKPYTVLFHRTLWKANKVEHLNVKNSERAMKALQELL